MSQKCCVANKVMILKKYIFLFLALVLAVFVPVFSVSALDLNHELPMLNWGMPSASWTDYNRNNFTIFADPEATETVRNSAPDTLPELLFNTNCVVNAASTSLVGINRCISFSNVTSMKIYNSKTWANSMLKSATAVFRYPDRQIIGDSFNSDGNFAFWGRHLRQTPDNSDSNAQWQLQGYSFNPTAQAYWDTNDPSKNSTMTATISRLLQNSKTLSTGALPSDFDGVCQNPAATITTCPEINQYPDGRIWDFNSSINTTAVTVGVTFKYQKKSSIIVKEGNLLIKKAMTAANDSSSIGFIVQEGDVTITNTSSSLIKIKTSIFAPNGTITINAGSGGIELTGSFVAKNFVYNDTGGISFWEDSRGESVWPPGFRDLQPLTTKSKL